MESCTVIPHQFALAADPDARYTTDLNQIGCRLWKSVTLHSVVSTRDVVLR